MKIARTIRTILTFYHGFYFFNLLITLSCLVLFMEYGWHIFRVLFWFKLATLGVVVIFINAYKRKEFYYYRNLGISPAMLWTVTLLCDFSFYIFLLLETYKLKS